MSKLKNSALIVFAGAGASAAVNPQYYPTTVEFFNRLPKDIVDHPLFKGIRGYLAQNDTSSNKTIDIEMFLWELTSLRASLRAIRDASSVTGHLVGNGRLAAALGHGATTHEPFIKTATEAVPLLDALEQNINLRVFDLYSRVPQREELNATWLPLLTRLLESRHRVELFTTNYDLVIEEAHSCLPPLLKDNLDIGWRNNTERTLDVELWRPGYDGKPGLLTKLHGSVNWSRRGDEIHVGEAMYKGGLEKHSLLFPGFKGEPIDEPFNTFHYHLTRTLKDAAGVLFIGFAFRDKHITDLCARSLPPHIPVVAIDPADDLTIPSFRSTPTTIQAGFDDGSATKAAGLLLRSVSAT